MTAYAAKMEQVLARDTADATRLLLSSLTTVEGTDTNGFPFITVGDVTISGGGAYISFVPEDTLQVDSLGNTQRVYAPHKIRIALETSSTSSVALMTSVTLAKLLQIVEKWGTKVEFWLEDNGTAPTNTTFSTASKKKADIYPDAFNPLRSQM